MKDNDYQIVVRKIRNLLNEKNTVIVAIDGRCASGKTTLAALLQEEFSCNVIHMDDFYLPMTNRDSDWHITPAKNIDFRKIRKVLDAIAQKESFEIRPFSCDTSSYGEAIFYRQTPLTVIEGSYSCHPELKGFYDLCIFLSVSLNEQKKRLIIRNGEEGLDRFQKIWIPLEEKYFNQYAIPAECDIVITN